MLYNIVVKHKNKENILKSITLIFVSNKIRALRVLIDVKTGSSLQELHFFVINLFILKIKHVILFHLQIQNEKTKF